MSVHNEVCINVPWEPNTMQAANVHIYKCELDGAAYYLGDWELEPAWRAILKINAARRMA